MEQWLIRTGRTVSEFLAARSPEEREKRLAAGVALLAVCGVGLARYVSGVTLNGAPFTLYPLAVAAAAAWGGFEAGVVATLGALLVAGVAGAPRLDLWTRVVFAAEALSIALIVSVMRSRLQLREAWLGEAGGTIASLRLRHLRARLLDAALQHLEHETVDSAIVLLDERGAIAEWRPSAERLYGYRAEDVIGLPAASVLADAPSEDEWLAWLRRSREEGTARASQVHRRQDGSTLEAEIEIKPFRESDARAFTLTVYDTGRRRGWEDYRRAATEAQAALNASVDHTRQQLAALESLTDPSLNPLGGPAMATELLERLRAAVRGDGAALVRHGRNGVRVMAAGGLQPAPDVACDGVELTPGRVAVVHNDPSRVAELSALQWSATASSLLVVPVVHDGQVWSRIEVVGERSRQVSDWDVALARVVADRLAVVVVQDRVLAAKAS